MASFCDITHSVYPATMNTIHYCSMLEFGRGACDQTLAPGITRLLHASANDNSQSEAVTT